jgi:hypothetical protein
MTECQEPEAMVATNMLMYLWPHLNIPKVKLCFHCLTWQQPSVNARVCFAWKTVKSGL